jgi:hypothetical protein
LIGAIEPVGSPIARPAVTRQGKRTKRLSTLAIVITIDTIAIGVSLMGESIVGPIGSSGEP